MRADLQISSIDTSISDAARLKAGNVTRDIIQKATSPLVCAFYRGDDGEGGGTAAAGDSGGGAKLYWLGAVTSKPTKYQSVWHVLTYLYDETVVTDEHGSRIAYDEPASGQKCPHAFGKCTGRASTKCKLWHQTRLPIGSIVPKLLAGRNVAKYFKSTGAGGNTENSRRNAGS